MYRSLCATLCKRSHLEVAINLCQALLVIDLLAFDFIILPYLFGIFFVITVSYFAFYVHFPTVCKISRSFKCIVITFSFYLILFLDIYCAITAQTSNDSNNSDNNDSSAYKHGPNSSNSDLTWLELVLYDLTIFLIILLLIGAECSLEISLFTHLYLCITLSLLMFYNLCDIPNTLYNTSFDINYQKNDNWYNSTLFTYATDSEMTVLQVQNMCFANILIYACIILVYCIAYARHHPKLFIMLSKRIIRDIYVLRPSIYDQIVYNNTNFADASDFDVILPNNDKNGQNGDKINVHNKKDSNFGVLDEIRFMSISETANIGDKYLNASLYKQQRAAKRRYENEKQKEKEQKQKKNNQKQILNQINENETSSQPKNVTGIDVDEPSYQEFFKSRPGSIPTDPETGTITANIAIPDSYLTVSNHINSSQFPNSADTNTLSVTFSHTEDITSATQSAGGGRSFGDITDILFKTNSNHMNLSNLTDSEAIGITRADGGRRSSSLYEEHYDQVAREFEDVDKFDVVENDSFYDLKQQQTISTRSGGGGIEESSNRIDSNRDRNGFHYSYNNINMGRATTRHGKFSVFLIRHESIINKLCFASLVLVTLFYCALFLFDIDTLYIQIACCLIVSGLVGYLVFHYFERKLVSARTRYVFLKQWRIWVPVISSGMIFCCNCADVVIYAAKVNYESGDYRYYWIPNGFAYFLGTFSSLRCANHFFCSFAKTFLCFFAF